MSDAPPNNVTELFKDYGKTPLINDRLETVIRSELRRILKHHGILDGVLEADLTALVKTGLVRLQEDALALVTDGKTLWVDGHGAVHLDYRDERLKRAEVAESRLESESERRVSAEAERDRLEGVILAISAFGNGPMPGRRQGLGGITSAFKMVTDVAKAAAGEIHDRRETARAHFATHTGEGDA